MSQLRRWQQENPLPHSVRILMVGLLYMGLLVVSLWLAYLLRFEFQISDAEKVNALRTMLWALPLKLVLLLGVFGSLRTQLGFSGSWGCSGWWRGWPWPRGRC